jgi:hypothetical protein
MNEHLSYTGERSETIKQAMYKIGLALQPFIAEMNRLADQLTTQLDQSPEFKEHLKLQHELDNNRRGLYRRKPKKVE